MSPLSTAPAATGSIETPMVDGLRRGKGVNWDPTINLGHMLTFAGFMIAGFSAWVNLSMRVTTNEQVLIAADKRAQAVEVRVDWTEDKIEELTAAFHNVRRSSDVLGARVDAMEHRIRGQR